MNRILSYILLFAIIGNAQTPDSLFVFANKAIEKEKYNTAILNYEKILSQGVESANLYYNLGNGYYRVGKIGLAAWSYEKGLQLSPRDSDLKFNLEITNTHVRDRIEKPKSIFLLEWYRLFKNMVTLNDLLLFGAGLFLVAAIIFLSSFWLLFRYRSKVIVVLIGLSIIIHLVAIDKYWDVSEIDEGIIITKEIKVYASPFEREDGIIFRLHEGIKVQVTQEQSQWMEISLLDGKKGWTRNSNLRKL